jgi:molybdate transport system substrate-binding protein
MLRAQSLTVFAAASLKQPLDKIGREYSAAMELDLRISYAASSVLARQIEFGAPADVFVSANLGWMKHLQIKNILAEPAHNVALNSLVIAALSGARPQNDLSLVATDLISRLGSGRLGVPLLDAVPLGLYTKQALTELHLIEPLSTYIVQQDNARSTLMSLLRGEIELAVLYASDVAANPGIISAVAIPSRLHDTVTYTVAPITLTGSNFAHYLTSPKAQAIFVEYGFLSP